MSHSRQLTEHELTTMDQVRAQVMAQFRPEQIALTAAADLSDDQAGMQARMDELVASIHQATEEAMFTAGQRVGLRLGLEVAALLLNGSAVAGISHQQASLLIARAMVSDEQAEQLIQQLVTKQDPAA